MIIRSDASLRTEVLLQRKLTHPGAILREDFLPEYGMTAAQLAEALGCAESDVEDLLQERCSVTPDMVQRLAKVFGTTPEFWLNL